MIIRAKFPSGCPVCGLPIAVRAKISYVRGRPAEHAECSEEAGKLRLPPEPLFNPPAKAERAPTDLGPGSVNLASNLVNVTKEIRSVLVVCPAGKRREWFEWLKKEVTREMAIGLTGWGPREVHWTDASRGSRTDGSITICDYDNLHRLGDRQTWDLLILDPALERGGLDPERSRVVQTFQTRAARHLTTTH